MSEPTAALAELWTAFAESNCRGYSPLYERISLAVAADRDVLELVRQAPPHAHLPPLLLAAVHDLLLAGLAHPLADIYAGRSDADAGAAFLDVCRARRDEIAGLLATRRIQTNECGRSAVIGPGLTWIAAALHAPLALVDVGASAGLNLLCDRYRLDYGLLGATGPTDSPVRIACDVVGGHPPIAHRLPELVERVGIDRDPVDLADPDDARWQLACVWPDTGRLERTAAAIGLARQGLPTVVAGDANAVLPGVLDGLPPGTAAIVLTTWAFAYLSIDERRRFVEILAAQSRARPVAWLSAEGADIVEPFGGRSVPGRDQANSDILGAVIFDGGSPREHLLAYVQAHGAWIDWRASDGPA